MKSYYIAITTNGVIIDIGYIPANNLDQAIALVTTAARGRGMENFSVRESAKEEFETFLGSLEKASGDDGTNTAAAA